MQAVMHKTLRASKSWYNGYRFNCADISWNFLDRVISGPNKTLTISLLQHYDGASWPQGNTRVMAISHIEAMFFSY